MKSFSFPPFIQEDSKLLILGTMPGVQSLEEQRYYAHKRNAFWPIMFELFDVEPTSDYNKRLNLLSNNRIALWDTLKLCFREGSLDSNIKNAQPNEINQLLEDNKQIKNVIFNGKSAEAYYLKFHKNIYAINYHTMPSTSPANARFKFADKLAAWSIIKEVL